MKTTFFAIFAVSSLALLVMLLATPIGIHPVQAALPSIASAGPDRQEPSATDYLIALPFPAAEALHGDAGPTASTTAGSTAGPTAGSVPIGLTPDQAAEYARNLTYEQARPILVDLRRLQAEGKIVSFEVRPDLHAVAVQLAPAPDMSTTLARLSNLGYLAAAEKDLPSCISGAADALAEQVLGLSHLSSRAGFHQAGSGAGAQVTNPSINVYAPPGASYTYVTGSTFPNTTVTIRILRSGRVLVSGARTSSSSGYYSFFPSYQSCPSPGYNWMLRAGDVVEVTAGGSTVSTIVADVSAWVDPVANVVAGATAAGRSVEVQLYHYAADACSSTTYTQIVSASGSGAFSANFTPAVNFNRRAFAYVYARDANGNSTFAGFNAYRISADFGGSSFGGYLKPDVDFTATLSRMGSIVSSTSGKSSASNYYSGYFNQAIQSGDVIQVSGGGVSIQYVATSLVVELDLTTDRASGVTGANRIVGTGFQKRTWGNVTTACSWQATCTSTVADGAGSFMTPNAGLDLQRGDYAYFYVYDAEGNFQYARRSVSAIVAEPAWTYVEGYWRTPGAYLTVVLKNSGGVVKSTQTDVWASSFDGDFYTSMGAIINPTDRIEVGNGVVTETMIVQNLTARLDGSTGHLTGSAYNGRLLAELWDFRRDGVYWFYYCSETTVSGGAYDLTFGGAQAGAQDYADMWSSGPDGHYTYRVASAFEVNAQKEGDYVWGYSETPNVPVTLTLKAGAVTKAVRTITSSSGGYYSAFLGSGTPVTIAQGDTLLVQTGDGDSASVIIPELTVNKDVVNNRLTGRSPAGEPVQPQPRRRYNSGWWSQIPVVTADAGGNYSASFNDLYWGRDCSAVQVGHHCIQPAVYYYNAAGHLVWLEGPLPPSVTADVYESDNTAATARAYSGIQRHTFHTTADVDWIAFTVSTADAINHVSYRIETFNLGWGMATRLRLYDTDGTTLLFDATGYDNKGRGVSTDWIPPAAGTYYLQISPPSSSYAAYCDAMYDLIILPARAKIHLPVVIRN